MGADDHRRWRVNGQAFLESCTPGYYNNEGKPGERSVQQRLYGGRPDRVRQGAGGLARRGPARRTRIVPRTSRLTPANRRVESEVVALDGFDVHLSRADTEE